MTSTQAVSHANAAYAGLPGPVTFDPPVSLAADVRMPECPACHEGTVFLFVCGNCGQPDRTGNSYCCGEAMLVRGAYVSVLGGDHSWLGCPMVGISAAPVAKPTFRTEWKRCPACGCHANIVTGVGICPTCDGE